MCCSVLQPAPAAAGTARPPSSAISERACTNKHEPHCYGAHDGWPVAIRDAYPYQFAPLPVQQADSPCPHGFEQVCQLAPQPRLRQPWRRRCQSSCASLTVLRRPERWLEATGPLGTNYWTSPSIPPPIVLHPIRYPHRSLVSDMARVLHPRAHPCHHRWLPG